ncbi:MAG TPA: efflux RND transporter periplasmic adaptor subunit [Fimbriimonadaceae bacterium]|nr:efflux RND transporter periplasmic adaptor subunit [Fimbriimonadaceae bacterium]
MKKGWVIGIVAALAGALIWFLFLRGGNGDADIEFRYGKIEAGELVRSISATGQLVALTTVDVKSKAGGKIVKLSVDEGAVIKKGDLIAEIDPADTRATFDQASADLRSAEARAEQARINAALQAKNSGTAIQDAEVAVELAKLRLARAEEQNRAQPTLSSASLRSAEANLRTQEMALDQLEKVTIPQTRREAEGNLERAKTDLDAADSDLKRQEGLHAQGYVALSAVERARSTRASAQAAHNVAKQRFDTLEQELRNQLETQRKRVDQAQAQLDEAKANQNQITISGKNLEEARKALRQAELSLARARDEAATVQVRNAEARSAEAGTVRSRVSVDNAKVQLDSTTVVAPRDGVVTLKYLEEGTIIPPGTSTFAQGTSIVQISDTTQMFVECAVDEADIAQVKEGQAVRIIVEAYPGQEVRGKVTRVNPAATTAQNITAIKVRVQVLPGAKVKLLPGMNATCEFLTLEMKDVLIAPMQAIQREGDKAYVRIKSSDPLKPVRREVKLGEAGNEGVQILEGLKPGEEVVIAEINLAQLRETQRRMQEAQQGGGLAGGQMGRPGGGGGGPRGGGGAGGGGARPSGGGGR